MTKEEFDERLEKLDRILAQYSLVFDHCKTEIEELKNAQIKDELPTPPHPKWKPENGERYYYLDCNGWINSSNTISSERKKDKAEIGNLFKSVEESKIAVERMKVLAVMREWAGNWDDAVALKYDGSAKLISNTFISPRQYTFGEMRFASREDAENCVKAVGEDRIKKYYFMISEEGETNE